MENHFFFALLAGVILLVVFIFLPYVNVLVLAITLAIIFSPVNRRIQKVVGNRESFAAFCTLCIIAVVVLAPLFFITFKIYGETRDLYTSLSGRGGSTVALETLEKNIISLSSRVLPEGIRPTDESLDLGQYVQTALSFGVSHLDTIFSRTAILIFKLFLLLVALYYTLRDGPKLKKSLVEYSPLVDTHDEQIFKKLELAVNSVVKGSLTVGVIQGVLTGIGFAIFGVPNPALAGSIAVITSLIPGVGTAIVLIPGVIYLFVTGSTGAAIGLLLWAVVAVGLIDNILGPFLVKRGINIHPFLILLSVIGGIGFFGPVGFSMGPLALSLLFALLSLYKSKMMNGVSTSS